MRNCAISRAASTSARVEPERETKSISSEETFEYDVSDEKVLIATIKSQAIEIAAKLQRENLSAQTVGVKLKRTDFSTFGRQTHLTEPTRDARRIYRAAVFCLRRAKLEGEPVRLLGTRVASVYRRRAASTEFVRRGERLAAGTVYGGGTRLHTAAAAITVVAAFDSSS